MTEQEENVTYRPFESPFEGALNNLLEQAESLASDCNFAAAETCLRQAVERYPDSPLPHHALSIVVLDQLRRDYDHLEVWDDLAQDEALFEEAIHEAETALELEPDFVPAHNNLGTLYALRGWWVDAIREWELSLSIRSDQSQVREEMLQARKHL